MILVGEKERERERKGKRERERERHISRPDAGPECDARQQKLTKCLMKIIGKIYLNLRI